MTVPFADRTPLLVDQNQNVGGNRPRSSMFKIYPGLVFRSLIGAVIAFGVFLTLFNASLPIARNALPYAKATLDIVEQGFNLNAVAQDHILTGSKPLLFSVIAAPLAYVMDVSSAVVVASALGTVFFLWTAALTLPRLNRHTGVSQRHLALQFAFAVYNPLVLYQFWSGYPDSFFGGLVLLAYVLTDEIASSPERDTRWHIVGLCLTICLAVCTKLYGAILILLGPALLLQHKNTLFSHSKLRRSKVILLCATFGLSGATLIAAKLNVNPFLVLGPNAGFDDYISGLTQWFGRDARDALWMLAICVLLTFHVLLLLLFRTRSWRAWSIGPTLFVSLYLLGLIPASGTSYNMRYFLPAFPFLTPALAAGMEQLSPRSRRLMVSGFVSIASLLVAIFNVAWVEEEIHPALTSLYRWQPKTEQWLDNLRLPVQLSLKRQIDSINKSVPDGGVLYWASDYYGKATHGLAHHLGVKRTLNVHYVLEPTDPESSPAPVYLTVFTSFAPPLKLWRAPVWATPANIGYGVFRLDPLSVKLVSLTGDYALGTPILIRAEFSEDPTLKVESADFIENNLKLASVLHPPFELIWRHPKMGRHQIEVRVNYIKGGSIVSSPLVIYAGTRALERAARDTSDFVMEYRDRSINAAQDVIHLDRDWRVGIRFQNIQLPPDAHVKAAYLTLAAAEARQGSLSVDIHGESSISSRGLDFQDGNLTQRALTKTHVLWSIPNWGAVSEKSRSPDLTPIIEEVLRQPGWQAGNSMMLIITTAGGVERDAQATDHNGSSVPTLHIEF